MKGSLPPELRPVATGSVTTPLGWQAGVAACRLRDGPEADLALIVSDGECSAAGVFTRNRVPAAPVQIDRGLLASDPTGLRAVVVNAGVANACTGEAGLTVARRTQDLAAERIGCKPDGVLLMSTGLIGASLNAEKMERGIEVASNALSETGGLEAARAIMTTDTRPKHRAIRGGEPRGSWAVGGIAKGAGMIHPDMATMLALVTTDVAAEPAELQTMLASAVEASFHRISVDGDTSTNDTVLLLANGASGRTLADIGRERFQRALRWLCRELAFEIVRDGEGATKLVRLQITGARDEGEALQAARTIATSPLVKTALAGGDPNWGRIVAAAGRSGVDLDPDALAMWVSAGEGDVVALVHEGRGVPNAQEAASVALRAAEVTLRLDLGVASGEVEFWTTDLTHDYVTINAEYHT